MIIYWMKLFFQHVGIFLNDISYLQEWRGLVTCGSFSLCYYWCKCWLFFILLRVLNLFLKSSSGKPNCFLWSSYFSIGAFNIGIGITLKLFQVFIYYFSNYDLKSWTPWHQLHCLCCLNFCCQHFAENLSLSSQCWLQK